MLSALLAKIAMLLALTRLESALLPDASRAAISFTLLSTFSEFDEYADCSRAMATLAALIAIAFDTQDDKLQQHVVLLLRTGDNASILIKLLKAFDEYVACSCAMARLAALLAIALDTHIDKFEQHAVLLLRTGDNASILRKLLKAFDEYVAVLLEKAVDGAITLLNQIAKLLAKSRLLITTKEAKLLAELLVYTESSKSALDNAAMLAIRMGSFEHVHSILDELDPRKFDPDIFDKLSKYARFEPELRNVATVGLNPQFDNACVKRRAM